MLPQDLSDAPGYSGPSAHGVPGQQRTTLRILQMDCPTESRLITHKLEGMPGVYDLQFNLLQRTVAIVHGADALPDIEAAIGTLGFTCEPADKPGAASSVQTPGAGAAWRLAGAGCLALAAESVHWLGGPGVWSAAFAVLAVLLAGAQVYRKGWTAIRQGDLNIHALMSLAVTGAVLIGQWPEAAMVMVLFAVAERVEAASLGRARKAIEALMTLAPAQASVRQPDGQWRIQAVEGVALGAEVRVKPGERIALDGQVLAGHSSVDQAPITGESLPVDKAAGDSVYAGTINQAGELTYRTTALAQDSTLARIIHAVEAAQASRAPTQRFVDRFSRVYTPTVIGLAIAVAVIGPLATGGDVLTWVYRALVLLVVACPCALVISTPVTVVSGLTAAARQGILVKGGASLERGRHLTWLALDKTGTLTLGQPAQCGYVELVRAPPDHWTAVAAALAARSDHPISRAVARAAGERALALDDDVTAFEALGGRGVRGRIDGRLYALGNRRLVRETGLADSSLEARWDALEAHGQTAVVLVDERRALAMFLVADETKPGAQAAVAALHAQGVRTLMLSGDHPQAVQAVAREVGIDEVRAGLLPQDKAAAIVALSERGEVVGMVGDGINDAPALARADIGFAMGVLGTDTAIETADVAIMDDDLAKVPRFIGLSRRTSLLLRQNIALAIGIKAVFLALTVMGEATMWMAVFADVGVSLLVVANGLRLLRA